ncbi:LPS-assembly protein LptD [Salinisphaera aquimarina]|uniref:LPS-assembly protein LptD n=1 Tax=Salinisphaera aquimarina TaxID=2094031 RepID=A0ABV7EWK5_9GAMM
MIDYSGRRRSLYPGQRVFSTPFIVGASLVCTGMLVAEPSIAAEMGCPVAPPPMTLPEASAESTLVADQASLQNEVAEATGNVRLERNGQALEAPFVRYDRKTGEARARDGLKYYRPGLFLTADNGDVQVDDETGQFNGATYSIITNGGRGEAGTVTSLGNGNYELTDANYSTCAGETKAWMLSAKRIKLDREKGRGEAFNSTMRFYGVPVFYSPYLNFPIDDKRHTGVLPPTIGASSDSGFELAVPYYINIAPNYDATIVPRLLADRGLQLGGQLRYLYAHHRGEFDGEYLPSDNKYGDDRSLFHYEHVGRFNPYVSIEANYTRVSDGNYFDDLSSGLSRTSGSQLERAIRLTMADTGIRFTLLAQDFQTLEEKDDNNSDNNFNRAFTNDPYTRLPQARLEMLSPSSPFQAGLNAEFSNFKRDDDIDAYRVDAQPRLLWGVDQGGWYANSEANYRVTQYRLRGFDDAPNVDAGDYEDDVITRDIPQFRAETGLRFARTFNEGWVQTLEPRLQYLYTGYEDQSNIPVFDSGVADLQFDRLFADNRFVGSDRIGDANQLTVGVTSRFISPDSGRTVAKLDLGRVTGFRDLRVNVPTSGEIGYGERGSDYVAGVEIRPTRHIRARTTVQYDPDDSRINRAIAAASYTTDAGYQLDLAYRRYRDYRPLRQANNNDNTIDIVPGEFESLEQTAIGVRAPVTANLDVLGRWNYSLERSQNVETLAGFEYRPSCCWAGRVAWRHYVADDDGSFDSAIMFQFVLNGLGQFGETVRSFVDNDVYDSEDTSRRSSDSFDTIRFP